MCHTCFASRHLLTKWNELVVVLLESHIVFFSANRNYIQIATKASFNIKSTTLGNANLPRPWEEEEFPAHPAMNLGVKNRIVRPLDVLDIFVSVRESRQEEPKSKAKTKDGRHSSQKPERTELFHLLEHGFEH